MKNFYRLFFTTVFTLFSIVSFSQLKVSSNGNVGVNKDTPAYNLDVNGNLRVSSAEDLIYYNGQLYPANDASVNLGGGAGHSFYEVQAVQGSFSSVGCTDMYANSVYFYSIYDMSDKSVKTNITDLSKLSYEKLFGLRPVRYNLALEKKTLKESMKAPETSTETTEHIGFIAQEVKEIFPELVGENKDGLLGIRYTELIPVLVQALKEQNEKIKNLEDRIVKLESVSK